MDKAALRHKELEEEFQRHRARALFYRLSPPPNALEDMEESYLCTMLDNAVYTTFTKDYLFYCEARGIGLPSKGQVHKIRMNGCDAIRPPRPWVQKVKQFIMSEEIGMEQHKDECMFTKHDQFGRLVLWVVTYYDHVLYGGLTRETAVLEEQGPEHVYVVKVGNLDLHIGVSHLLRSD